MPNSSDVEVITLAYRDVRSRFAVQHRTDDILRGCFRWTDDEKAQIIALLEQEDKDGKQPWYLEEDGYRLDDEKLFQVSPWSIVDRESCTKVVQRTMHCNSGEASFVSLLGFGLEMNSIVGPLQVIPEKRKRRL